MGIWHILDTSFSLKQLESITTIWWSTECSCSNQINIDTFLHQCETQTSPIWWTKIAIFIWFELRTPIIGVASSVVLLNWEVQVQTRSGKVGGHYNNVEFSVKLKTSFQLYPVTEAKQGTFPFLSFLYLSIGSHASMLDSSSLIMMSAWPIFQQNVMFDS